MKLSIVIPLYNKENHIYNTIQSVLNQDFIDFEIVIVNDGSTDSSRAIIEDVDDTRIRLINKPNGGVSSARNIGINEAKGDYICLLDADDTLLPNALSHFDEMLKDSNGCEILVGSFVEKNEVGSIVNFCINKRKGILLEPLNSLRKKELHIRMGNIFVKKDIIKRNGGMRCDITLYEDLEWILRTIRNSTVYSSEHVVLEYRRYRNGLSYKKVNISKDFAGHIVLNDVNNYDEKLILANFLFRRCFKRLLSMDFNGAILICKNNVKDIFFILKAFALSLRY